MSLNKSEDLKSIESRFRRNLLSTSAIAACLMVTAPAISQDNLDGQDVDEDEVEEVIVTGSRIRRSGLTTPTPTTILNAEAIEATGAINVIDILNELPQVAIGFTNENTSFSFGNAGLNQANLRNLGQRRTLTLINSRRAVGAPSDSNFLAVDVSTIPTELIERVEVVTGGASAVYGADAVAGVINFILKDDFEGISVRAQGGVSEEGDNENYTVSATAGGNFSDGKGNAVVSVEYADFKGLVFRDRQQAIDGIRFIGNPDNTGPDDGIPDQIRADGLRFVRFGIPNGTVEAFRNLDGTASNVLNVFSFDGAGDTFLAIPGDEIIDGFLTRNEFGGIPGFTDRAIVPLNRYNAFGRVTYEVFEDIKFNLQARYSRTESADSIGSVFAINAGIGMDCFGLLTNSVKYVSPTVSGFTLSTSWGENDFFDVVLKYAGQFGDFKVAGAIGYINATSNSNGGNGIAAAGTDVEVFNVAGGFMHVPTGIFANFDYNTEKVDSIGGISANALVNAFDPNARFEDNPESFYLKVGIKQKWNSLGATSIFGDYGIYKDRYEPLLFNNGVTGSEITRWGVGVNQWVDAAAMQLYVKYTHLEFEVDAVAGSTAAPLSDGIRDWDEVVVGGIIFF